jgi:uncharacterized protein (DUF2235 family)
MAKNIVVCCDGTANEFARDRTNVVKLFHALVHDPAVQATYYHPGVGTMEAVGAVTTAGRKVTKLLGLAIGYGLEADIRDAYVFLMNHFKEGDRLFLFGFSRGAYTVRCVSSLLRMYGLIRPGNEPLVPYAIRMMMAITKLGERKAPQAEVGAYFELADEFKQHFGGERCQPHFVGVWDTVSSVGWIENPLRLPFTGDNPDIAIGRHAIALDERRAFFRTNLWRPSPAGGPKDLKQVWFPGVHCDVGGGYPEAESGLSKIALQWMLDEAKEAELLIDTGREAMVLGRAGGGYVPPDPNAPMHESLTGLWKVVEFVPKRHYNFKRKEEERRMNLFRCRTIPAGASIHPSAYKRGAEYTARLERRMKGEG